MVHAEGDDVTLVKHGLQFWDGFQLTGAAGLGLPYDGQNILHSLGAPHEVEHAQVHDLTVPGKHLVTINTTTTTTVYKLFTETL